MARIPYVAPDDLDEEYRDLVVSTLQPDKTINVYSAIANNPPVIEGLRAFLGSVWTESGLSDRERELVILAVAREFDSAYEWHQHVNVARNVGLPGGDVNAISSGDYDAFDQRERTLLRYALATVRGEVDDEIHESAAVEFDDSTLVGIAALAAGYAAMARVIGAFDVEVEDQFVGWEVSES